MIMEIGFPGGVKVDAHFRDHRVTTDQPEKGGGANTAPAPFDMFLASIGTCAGFYALRFCQQRGIDPEKAVSMIVNGFCKEVFRELPMEFAVEAGKLLEVSLEGAVG